MINYVYRFFELVTLTIKLNLGTFCYIILKLKSSYKIEWVRFNVLEKKGKPTIHVVPVPNVYTNFH